MLKYILTICLLLTAVVSKSVEAYVKEIYNMPNEKKIVLMHSYLYGLHHDWGRVLPAIAWKESNLEPNSASPADGSRGSYGFYQVQVWWHLKAIKKPTTEANIKLYKHKLTTDHLYNAQAAVGNLDYWASKYGKESLTKILASYNGGSNGLNIPSALAYAEDIKNRMRAIRIVFEAQGLRKYMEQSYSRNNGNAIMFSKTKALAMMNK